MKTIILLNGLELLANSVVADDKSAVEFIREYLSESTIQDEVISYSDLVSSRESESLNYTAVLNQFSIFLAHHGVKVITLNEELSDPRGILVLDSEKMVVFRVIEDATKDDLSRLVEILVERLQITNEIQYDTYSSRVINKYLEFIDIYEAEIFMSLPVIQEYLRLANLTSIRVK